MFCDLVGSTSLAATLDAEDWRDLVGAYLDDAAKAIGQYGGHVAKKLGDGLMALFGYPRAQENDAERAVRAGLTLLRALEDLNAANAGRGLPALAARIGLDSGPVVVDSSGRGVWRRSQPRRSGAKRGRAGNDARHGGRAATGRGPVRRRRQRPTRTQRRSGFCRFCTGSCAPAAAAGAPARECRRRLSGAKTISKSSSNAGSAHEAGAGQFVQIVGEPGLGKSRLIDEFRGRLAETPHSWVEWASSQLLQNTALHPLAEWGKQRFGGVEVAPESGLPTSNPRSRK